MRINELMALTESAAGFNGGSYTDEMPEMSLDEAINTLPVVIVESQMSFLEQRNAQNEALVEATINAVTGGYEPDYMAISEASFEDVKKKIKAFFDRILKFLRSIINKLKLQIDKIRMSGHQLWAKYKDSKLLKDKKFTDLTYNGYDIMESAHDNIFGDATQYADAGKIQELMSAAVGGSDKFMDPREFGKNYADPDKEKDAKEYVDKLTNLSSSDRAYNVAAVLVKPTITSLTKDGWEADCRSKLYKEKIDIKYGTKGYTLDNLGKMLQEPANLTAIRDEYVRIEQAAKEHYSQLDKSADDNKKLIDEAEKSNEEGSTKRANALSIISSYYSVYMTCVSDTYAVINKVKSIKWNFYKTRNDQAKAMFGKMLSYKDPKSNNNDASDVDELDVLMDFAL